MFQAKPGKTTLVEHYIHAYCIPRAYCDPVKAELDQMLESGIIEPSSNQWAAPLVKKRTLP